MKKKITVLLGVLLCLVVCGTMFVACSDKKEDAPAEIKPETTIEISTAEDLVSATQYVGTEYSRYTLKLMNDIDVSNIEWKPIGLTLNKAFCGVFDGNNHTINGLKITGWDENGKPKYIAKRILGWVNGQPIYSSTEIISLVKGANVSENASEVTDIIYEGDNEDPNYVSLCENGTAESNGTYGSVGLFGYTRNATIKNLTVNNADISFYSSGSFAYAGIISGYDVASTFEKISISDCKIAVSTIYEQKISYYDYYATPERISNMGVVTEYAGGVVGYSKSSTEYVNGVATKDSSTFTDVTCNNFVFDNTNYTAYYDAGLSVVGDKSNSKLVRDENVTSGYTVIDIQARMARNSLAKESFPLQVYAGGLAGYLDGAVLNNVGINGYNKASYKDTTNELINSTQILARSIYIGGVAGCLYNGNANNINASDVYINSIYWRRWNNDNGYGLIGDKATAAGAFALLGQTSIVEGNINNLYIDLGGNESLSTVCIGGFAGYCYDKSSIKNVNVQDLFAYSNYTGGGSEELSSIMAGAVGVLRDSALEDATVEGVGFELANHLPADNVYIKGIVSQVYGDSKLINSTAKDVVNYTSKISSEEYSDVAPVQYKNNYVNEDGNTSVHLFYSVDGATSGVYVTVYGEIVPYEANKNSLVTDYIYKVVDLSSQYTDGAKLPLNRYYYYNATSKSYNYINDDTADNNKLFNSNNIYAEKTQVYKIGLANENYGKAMDAGKYYEYEFTTGKYVLSADTTFNQQKTYYTDYDESLIAGYYLNITVNTESGNVVVTDQKNKYTDDDDILAKAVYQLTKEEVANAVTTVQCGTTTYVLANSEIFINKYFAQGTGFIADINGFVIKSYDNAANRDFAKYVFISGRPVVENLRYIR